MKKLILIACLMLAGVVQAQSTTEYEIFINPQAPSGVPADQIAGYESALSCDNGFSHSVYNFGATPVEHLYRVPVNAADDAPVCTGTATWFNFAADYAPREDLSIALEGPTVPIQGTVIGVRYSPHIINDLRMNCEAIVECSVQE